MQNVKSLPGRTLFGASPNKIKMTSHNMKKKNIRCLGIVLTEVLLAFGVLSVAFAVVLPVFWQAIDAMGAAAAYAQATYLLEEQLEVVEFLRDEDWLNMNDGRYYVAPQAGQWGLLPTATGEGEVDDGTKLVLSVVEWSVPRSGRMEREMYLTRYQDNLSWIQTLQEEFDLGELDYTETTLVSDGEFQLAGGCFEGSAEAMIYDDQLRNDWEVSTTRSTLEVDSTEYTWDGSSYSMKATFEASPGGDDWPAYFKFTNKSDVCTVGFKFLRFQVYNPSATEDLDFSVRAVQAGWETMMVVVPPNPGGEWYEVLLDYSALTDDPSSSVVSLYFRRLMSGGEPAMVFWIDQLELTGGISGGGGYYQEGTLTSQVFDAGSATVFNQITWVEVLPLNTRVGFQVAVSDDIGGPWEYYGPGGTTDIGDRYIQGAGSGIFLGQNQGRYMRWKAYLNTDDGLDTPVVEEVIINYSP
jgi:hypothetical protein